MQCGSPCWIVEKTEIQRGKWPTHSHTDDPSQSSVVSCREHQTEPGSLCSRPGEIAGDSGLSQGPSPFWSNLEVQGTQASTPGEGSSCISSLALEKLFLAY